jgi:hypothetical protein
MADLSRILIGTRYTYEELARSEDLSFKLRMIIRQWILHDVTPETTLESHLYYMETSEISYEVLCQLKARVRLNYPVRKGGSVLYREKILKIQELAALSPAEKKRQDLRLAELQLSKLALMQFSF